MKWTFFSILGITLIGFSYHHNETNVYPTEKTVTKEATTIYRAGENNPQDAHRGLKGISLEPTGQHDAAPGQTIRGMNGDPILPKDVPNQ